MPANHLNDRGRCGSCRAPLEPLGAPVEVNESEFDDVIRGAKVPVLVDFWASWCGPCRSVAPELHKAAHKLQGKAIVLKVNTEREGNLAARYRVQSIPHFLVFEGGKVSRHLTGAVGQERLVRLAVGAD